MEYMLLRNGTVLPYEPIANSVDILAELKKQGGLAYYWRHTADSTIWMRIYAGSGEGSAEGKREVPVVIKLAAMLE